MLTNFPNGITSYGMPVVGGGVPFSFGKYYFVDYALGSDGNAGLSPNEAFKTLTAAYNACTSNMDDTIIIRGYSTVVDAPIAWTKNRIHVYGSDGTPGRLVQQGAKISSTTAGALSYVIKDTGTRNSFVNLKFIQNSAVATALTVLELGGEGTYLANCSAVFGVADNLSGTTAHEIVAGTDSASMINCTFGSDVLLTSGARTVFLIDQVTSGQEFKSNYISGCKFIISSSETTAELISMAANTDVLFTNLFEDCTFMASIDTAGGVALARAVSTANGLTKGTLYFTNPRPFGITNFGVNGTNNDGLYVIGALVVATDLVGVQPVAT